MINLIIKNNNNNNLITGIKKIPENKTKALMRIVTALPNLLKTDKFYCSVLFSF